MIAKPPLPKDLKTLKAGQDEYERKMERWFRHLPPDHPLVKVLFKVAVDRARGFQEILPADRRR